MYTLNFMVMIIYLKYSYFSSWETKYKLNKTFIFWIHNMIMKPSATSVVNFVMQLVKKHIIRPCLNHEFSFYCDHFVSSGVFTSNMSVIFLCSVWMAEYSSDITDWGVRIYYSVSSQGAMSGHLYPASK